MTRKPNAGVIALIAALYCGLSWFVMRADYFTADAPLASQRQTYHLSFTALVFVGLMLWKGHSIEAFIQRLSSLPVIERIAPFAVAAFVVFTMIFYPRSRPGLNMPGWALMESTRMLLEGLFLAAAAFGISRFVSSHISPAVRVILQVAERLIFQSRRGVFVAVLMLIVFLETNALSLLLFCHVPLTGDEVNYIFQAKIFAGGHLYAQQPQYPEFFEFIGFIIRDKWYSIVPPGFPAILVAGVLLRATWIVNPVLAALCSMLVFLIGERMYDERIGRASAALMIVSPFFVMLSSTQLAHTCTAFFFLLFLYLFLRGLAVSRPLVFALAGLALGAMFMTRPLTAVAVSIPWMVYAAWLGGRRKIPASNLAALVLGIGFQVALFLAYNAATRGDPFSFSYADFQGRELAATLPQQADAPVTLEWNLLPHQGLIDLNHGLFYLNHYLLGWPLPALLFAMMPFALPSRNKWDSLLLGHLLVIPAAYFVVRQNLFMGPRNYFTLIPAAVILTARGFREGRHVWERLTGRMSSATGTSTFLAGLISVCILFNIVHFMPDRFGYYRISSPIYFGVPSPVWRYVESEKIHNAVIFIERYPFPLAYGTGLWRNDPALRADIIYVRSQKFGNERLMEQYPGRRYYRYIPVFEIFEEIFPGQPPEPIVQESHN